MKKKSTKSAGGSRSKANKATKGAAKGAAKGANGGKKIRYAVVGLGHIAQSAVLPSFKHARKNSELVALVSGEEKKLREVGKKYGIDQLYTYEQYDDLLSSGTIDAVYIALPNDQHRDYVVRAARAGLHVLCEKPMATSSADCQAMIEAASNGGVKLMIVYRLHFDEGNLKAIKIAQSGKIGEPRYFTSSFSYVAKQGNIRLQAERGGGPLWDIGVYCINAARYLFRSEPIEVMATATHGGDGRQDEVEESISAIMKFPGECTASFTCSFGAAPLDWYQLVGTKGDIRMDSAYEYTEKMRQTVTIKEKAKQYTFKKHDQFGPELFYFSDCVLKNREPEPNGYEGLADVRIVEALKESARTRKAVTLEPFDRDQRPTMSQQITRPPVQEPKLVEAEAPVDEEAA